MSKVIKLATKTEELQSYGSVFFFVNSPINSIDILVMYNLHDSVVGLINLQGNDRTPVAFRDLNEFEREAVVKAVLTTDRLEYSYQRQETLESFGLTADQVSLVEKYWDTWDKINSLTKDYERVMALTDKPATPPSDDEPEIPDVEVFTELETDLHEQQMEQQ